MTPFKNPLCHVVLSDSPLGHWVLLVDLVRNEIKYYYDRRHPKTVNRESE